MPTRSGPPDVTTADLAGRLSALRVPPATTPSRRGGWLPERPADTETAPPPPELPAAPGRDASHAAPSLGSLLRGAVEDRLPVWAPGLPAHGGRRTVLALLAVLLVAVVALLAVVHHRSGTSAYTGSSWPGSTSVAGPAATPETGAGEAAPGSPASSIVVDVGGKVRRPGLVTLPPGSRVADAIAAAGGALRRRDVATMDLAARVGDGQLLLVGAAGAAADGGTTGADPAAGGSGPAAPVNLSSADLTTLETLPGVGPVTAQKIIDWRTAHNGFTSIEQLQQVPGIGPAHYAEIESLVTP